MLRFAIQRGKPRETLYLRGFGRDKGAGMRGTGRVYLPNAQRAQRFPYTLVLWLKMLLAPRARGRSVRDIIRNVHSRTLRAARLGDQGR